MPPVVFAVALVVGAALLALWVDVRFPKLAPRRLQMRLVVAALAYVAVATIPVPPTVAGLVGLVLPVLSLGFLTGIWLLRELAQRSAV
jgi:hypothetical protein